MQLFHDSQETGLRWHINNKKENRIVVRFTLQLVIPVI